MTEALDPRLVEFTQNWLAENANAMRIAGFGPDDPPVPQDRPAAPPSPMPADAEDESDPDRWKFSVPETPVSPLIPIKPKLPELTAEHLVRPPAALDVMDGRASYKGQPVELTEAEQGAIASIVLRAIQRRLNAQLKEVNGRLPKRVRVRREADEAPKRGRPKKGKPASG